MPDFPPPPTPTVGLPPPDWDSGWVTLPTGATEFTHNLGTDKLMAVVWIKNHGAEEIIQPYMTDSGIYGWISWISDTVVEISNNVKNTEVRIMLWKIPEGE